MTFDGQEVKVLNIDSAKAVGIAHINGTVAVINFLPGGTLRDGYFCSRTSGNYAVGDTRWQYNYYYSYDGSAWKPIALSSSATNFVIEVASGTDYIHLRADVVNHQTYRNYTYQSGSHFEGKLSYSGGYTTDYYGTYSRTGVSTKADSTGTYDVHSPNTVQQVYGERWYYDKKVLITRYVFSQLISSGNWISAPYVSFRNDSSSTRYIWLSTGWGESIWSCYPLSKNQTMQYPDGNNIQTDNRLGAMRPDYTTIQRWETT